MPFVIDMRARLLVPLLLCVAVCCSRGLPEGATSVYLTIQNGPGLEVPDDLLLSADGDGTPVYTDKHLPTSGASIANGPGGVLGTVTIYAPAGVAELAIVVSGYKNQVKRAEGSVRVRVSDGRQLAARVTLNPFSDSADGSVQDGAGVDGIVDGSSVDQGTNDTNDAGGGTDAGMSDAPGCGASAFSGSTETPTGTVDLSAEGTSDWRFWGPSGAVSYKRTAGNLISDYTLIGSGPVTTRFRNAVAFSWSDGSPTLTTTGAADSMTVAGTVGGGASITVPATATSQTLSVYVGGSNDTGLIQASPSDGCFAEYAASANNGRNDYTVVYRFTFKSMVPGTVLNVKWTMAAGSEAIGLYAATLK
jgi:hypothetical protein